MPVPFKFNGPNKLEKISFNNIAAKKMLDKVTSYLLGSSRKIKKKKRRKIFGSSGENEIMKKESSK